ncbi:hypothetical protein RRF57_003860 [Xylaria bambusicola]|uniref:Rieske domain-containing protein n=1 Tax=Xylaria bambusicola TaxID=326684 RepID=A0AAN7YWM8_9PEZI
MTTPYTPFVAPSEKGDAWFFAGVTSSFPNLDESGVDVIHEPRLCRNGESVRGCKVFDVPQTDSSRAEEVKGDAMISHNGAALQDQVLIFQYKGKIHAVDNVSRFGRLNQVPLLSCHAEMPSLGVPINQYGYLSERLYLLLSRTMGTPFDIEDFGVVLSAGIHCPKHGWSFDLFTGKSDRNNYMLRRWDVELRPAKISGTETDSDDSQKGNKDAQEVWVRRKQRIG